MQSFGSTRASGQRVVEDSLGNSFAVFLTANPSPAVSSFVVDPGYPSNYYKRIRSIANGPSSFLSSALFFIASLKAVL
jgi:hypothetical protein